MEIFRDHNIRISGNETETPRVQPARLSLPDQACQSWLFLRAGENDKTGNLAGSNSFQSPGRSEAPVSPIDRIRVCASSLGPHLSLTHIQVLGLSSVMGMCDLIFDSEEINKTATFLPFLNQKSWVTAKNRQYKHLRFS